MSESHDSLEILFAQAIEIKDPKEQEAFLQRSLAHDPDRIPTLRELISDHKRASWMDSTPQVVRDTLRLFEDLRGKQIGPFLVENRIGSGGMGDVYLAKQITPVRRPVALKLIYRDLDQRQVFERFQREKQMLATMEHPNIARIIDAGTSDTGYSYIAMEYIDGEDLLSHCKSNRLDIPARIQLLLQCCRAVQHAHQKGIIHRDIKPNNVLVALVDQEPMIKVIDFGIAKASLGDGVRESNDYTSSVVSLLSNAITGRGNSPGTPPYMSPEQFSKDGDLVDARSDIYSLGALLYVLLTESPPFDRWQLDDKSIDEIRELVQGQDPVLPSRRAPSLAAILKGDLDAIVSKAMHRDVEKRYQSVAQLHEDLRHYLLGETVSCNAGSSWIQICKIAKRNRLLIGASGVALAGLFIALIGLSMGWLMADKQRRRAMVDAMDANLLTASMQVQKHEFGIAAETLGRVANAGDPAQRRLDYRLLRSQIPQAPRSLVSHPTKIHFGVGIPSQRAIAFGCKDHSIELIDSDTGKELWRFDAGQNEINGLAVSPDEQLLASAGDDGTIKFWDLDRKQLASGFQASRQSVFQVAWSPDGKSVIAVGNEPNAKLWSYPDFRLVREIESSGVALECVAAGRQGQFAFGDELGQVRIGSFDSEIHQVFNSMDSETTSSRACSCLAFSDSGKWMAVGQNGGYLTILQKGTEEYFPSERIRFPQHVTSVSFSHDELELAIGEDNGQLHILNLHRTMAVPKPWTELSDLKEQRRIDSWTAHRKRISGIVWSKINSSLSSFSEDGTVAQLDLKSPRFRTYPTQAFNIYFLSDQELLLLGDQNTSLTRLTFEPTVSKLPELRIEPSQSGQSLLTIQGTEGLFCAKPVQESKDSPAHWSLMRFDPREDQFVTVGELPKEHQLVHLIGCPNLNQWLIRCTRTSDTAPIGKQETFLGLWDTRKNAFIWTTDFDSSSFRHAEMSPNGRLMVYEQATKIFLVDSNTGAHRQIAHQPDLSVSHLKFSPDSKLLAVALNENGTIGGYRVADPGKKIWEIRMHGGPIRDLCWSKDQQILLSLGGDGRLRTYDLNSLRISSEIALPISDPKHLRLGGHEQSVLVLDNQGSILRIPCSDSTAIGAE